MNLFVLFGQRICDYPGEYALEAIACASEADMDGNPEYLPEQKAKYEATKEFERLAVVTLSVKESDIRAIMFPENKALTATVIAD
jgi:hypothetical protein